MPRGWTAIALTLAAAVGCGDALPQAVGQEGDGGSSGASLDTGNDTGVGADDGVPDDTLDGADADAGSDGVDDGGPAVCGNGVIDEGEQCDLGELNGTGDYCRLDCRGNTCPDGYLGPGESCDDGDVDDSNGCTNACGPASCGDGLLQPDNGEVCDDGPANAETGACLPSCQPASCGDGFVHVGMEVCDGPNLAGESCRTQDRDGGTLACAPDCDSLDLAGCHTCGDGVREGPEACDGTQFPDGMGTCMAHGFGGGTLACSEACQIDTSGCTTCGNGVLDPGEACDGMQFGGASCESMGFAGGTLACNACTISTGGCCHGLSHLCGQQGACCPGLTCGNGGACCVPQNGSCGGPGADQQCCSGNCDSGSCD